MPRAGNEPPPRNLGLAAARQAARWIGGGAVAGIVAFALLMLAFQDAGWAAEPDSDEAEADRPPPSTEVLLEGGLAVPRGYLAGDWGTARGANARAGYEVGFRTRFFIAPRWALSPALHYDEFKSYNGVEESQHPLEVQASVLHFGLDVQYFPGARRGLFQPYFGAGAGVARNRYQEDRGEAEPLSEGVTSMVLSFGLGARVASFELSLVYRYDRFETIRFVDRDANRYYRWDHIVLRLGWCLPYD